MNSKRYLYMRGTIQALLELGAIPIVNENDAVSADEIKIGDNDTLSAIVASVAEADLLIILSDIQGLYTKDPKSHPDAELIHEVPAFSRELFAIAGGAGTARSEGRRLAHTRRGRGGNTAAANPNQSLLLKEKAFGGRHC